jgi:ABC-type molybdenum transport system ATPase subunit/photorepair protein PhrA
MAHLLGAEALHLEYPAKVVFDSVSLGVNEGDRIGIVGRNGDGKSSLLAMLAGQREPDSGRVTMRGRVRIGVLDQADTLDDEATVGHTVVGETPEHEWAGDPRVRDVIAGSWATWTGTPGWARSPAGSAVASPLPDCSPATTTSWRWTSRPTTWMSRRSPGSPRT